MSVAATLSRADDGVIDLIFREARSHKAWRDAPVPRALLQQVVELAQAGPTATSSQPMRIVFVESQPGKERPAPGPARRHLNAHQLPVQSGLCRP